MKYSLPSRELIADCVETMVNAHRFDGMVCIPKCDKIIPGMIMGTLRCNIPTIFLIGGMCGACVGHVSPEAADGGPIGLLKEGDLLSIDIPARKIEVKPPAGELDRRNQTWVQPAPRFTTGWLARYAKMATSASTGAVLRD